MTSNFRLISPEATTNLFENPSFENDLTGWDQDTGTWTTITTDQFFGAKCAKVTALDTGEALLDDIITVETTTYTLQAMIKRAAGGVVSSTQTTARFNDVSLAWTSITHIQDGWY